MSLLAALKFLTSLPLPGKDLSPEKMGRSTAFFPLAGLVIGGILAGLYWLLDLILPASIVSLLVLTALVLLTGAMHLDGLADSCDGLGGHKTAEQRLEVMRDSRIGAFGVVGIVLVLLAKYITLVSIPAILIIPSLLFMPVVSRWAMAYAIFAFPYARPSGLGTIFKQATRWPQFVIATVITMVIAAGLFPLCQFSFLLTIVGVWAVTALLAVYLKSRFAGLTGDSYGAVNEVAEFMVLIFIIILTRAGLA